MARKQPETYILNAVREVLQLHGWYVIRIQQGIGAHKGLSDLIAARSGEVFFIEVKTPTGKLSEHQKQFKENIVNRDCNYIVARGIDDVMHLCERIT